MSHASLCSGVASERVTHASSLQVLAIYHLLPTIYYYGFSNLKLKNKTTVKLRFVKFAIEMFQIILYYVMTKLLKGKHGQK